jgi:hypothetical protein
MGLVVIMIVLIMVMGAGLLTFVQKDLESVVEVNNSQKALSAAEAGLQTGQLQLYGDKERAHYDVDDTPHPLYFADCDVAGSRDAEAADSDVEPLAGPSWSPEDGGVVRTFPDGESRVTIRWLNPSSIDPECQAPETSPPPDVDYFRVVSEGTSGDARRKVEAVYKTYDLAAPRAYYTPGDIEISGTAKIQQVSLFSGGNIEIKGSAEVSGQDINYEKWASPSYPNDFNSTARAVDTAGVAAAKKVSYTGGATNRLGTRDFDNESSYAGPKFYKNLPDPDNQGAGEITYPFDSNNQLDPDRLCGVAKTQQASESGHYIEYDTRGNKSLDSWPSAFGSNSVVCVTFKDLDTSNTLKWNVSGNTNLASPYDGCRGPIQEGTLVIRGGNFTTQPNKALFRGVVVVRGPAGADGSDLGSSIDTGNTCLDGFVNATGKIKIAGTVRPSSSPSVDSPGFHGVDLWSWRERYE